MDPKKFYGMYNKNSINKLGDKPVIVPKNSDLKYKKEKISNAINRALKGDQEDIKSTIKIIPAENELTSRIEKLEKENKFMKDQIKKRDIVIKNLNTHIQSLNKKLLDYKTQNKELKRLIQGEPENFFDFGQGHFGFLDDNFNDERIQEQLALQAVDQQILDELCPDPDKMSYEQLLQLEENVGNVSKGLKKEKIDALPMVKFYKGFYKDCFQCIICMESYNELEMVKKLPCGHIFHKECIAQWLIKEKTCPFCKKEIR